MQTAGIFCGQDCQGPVGRSGSKAFGNLGGEGCWGLLLFPWEEVLASGIPLGCGLLCWQTVEVELESWDHLLRQHHLCLRCEHVQMACGTKVWVSGSHHSDSGWRGVAQTLGWQGAAVAWSSAPGGRRQEQHSLKMVG